MKRTNTVKLRMRLHSVLATASGRHVSLKDCIELEKTRKLSELKTGKCIDCARAFRLRDDYIVRTETWAEAALQYDSGCLHKSCLEARLGRKLKFNELIFWFVRDIKKDCSAEFCCHRDYLNSPEYQVGERKITDSRMKNECWSCYTLPDGRELFLEPGLNIVDGKILPAAPEFAIVVSDDQFAICPVKL
jgi:hypothetical protein